MSSVGWAGGQLSVGEADQPPAALMDRPMMSPTHQAPGWPDRSGHHAASAADDAPHTRPAAANSQGTHSHHHAPPGRSVGRPQRPGWPGPPPAAGSAHPQGPGATAPPPPGAGPPSPRGRRSWPLVAGGLAGDQDPGQRAITSQPATRLRRQRPRPANLPPRARAAEEAVQVHHAPSTAAAPHRSGAAPHPPGPGGPTQPAHPPGAAHHCGHPAASAGRANGANAASTT